MFFFRRCYKDLIVIFIDVLKDLLVCLPIFKAFSSIGALCICSVREYRALLGFRPA